MPNLFWVQSLLTFWMLILASPAQAVLDKPAYPVIFIHGLNSNAVDAWGDLRKGLVLPASGWQDGGTLLKHSILTNMNQEGNQLNPADFYALDFSSSSNLTFMQQGVEVRNAVTAVLLANPIKDKVILVAHSMGGLAARSYLQGQAGNFRNDVAALITVGTPHRGTMEAKNCNFHAIACWLAFLSPNSVAMNALIPGSDDLAVLNAPGTVLPHSIQQFVSIVVTWNKGYTLTDITTPSTLSTPDGRRYREGGDGMVTATSQDLSKLFNFTPPNRHRVEPVVFPVDPGPSCARHHTLVWDINQVHTCETRDSRVTSIILRGIIEVRSGQALAPMIATIPAK